ncbi:MAG TPA: 3-hydroxyacyl-CoA dehydrogenase NAD-binding domain-containing protein [Bacteroidia bacterium]|nr:3-hydroxyacyl-CoA dehydrogenase NAD-binding domain-containing protein [Bacteroidia bacterium]
MFSSKTKIGVIGSGAMGSGIAQVAATAGHLVVLYDSNAGQLSKAKSSLASTLKMLAEKGKISAGDADLILQRIQFAEKLDSFRDCGLIIEAIIEQLSVKQEVFSELEKIVPASCVLATNTSSLSITSIAASCKDPSRVIGIHFFNPAPVMPLVEIIPGIVTNSAITEAVKKLVDSWGKTTVLAKDTPGFIVNRVARSYYGESIRIYEEGIADFATIDWAMKTFGGFKMGPFELMDFIGNDVNYAVTETVWQQFYYEPRFKPSLTQKRLYEAKMFGRKSGSGYYDYADGAVKPQPKSDELAGRQIFMRVLSMLINEAADALYLGVASREDLDTAMMKGVNYPKGLLKWCDEIGVKAIYETLQKLFDQYGEDRYRPCILLKRMAAGNKAFFV